MNDKELADKVVALGVLGWFETVDGHDGSLMTFAGVGPIATRLALRDWRVAGALMELGQAHFIEKVTDTKWAVRSDKPYGEGKTREWYGNESLPRAIIEACVEALGEDKKRIKVLEDAIELDLNDAKFNCGKHSDTKAPHCEAYISRGLTCSDCPMHWLHHSEQAIAAADEEGDT